MNTSMLVNTGVAATIMATSGSQNLRCVAVQEQSRDPQSIFEGARNTLETQMRRIGEAVQHMTAGEMGGAGTEDMSGMYCSTLRDAVDAGKASLRSMGNAYEDIEMERGSTSPTVKDPIANPPIAKDPETVIDGARESLLQMMKIYEKRCVNP
jgi:hypothetical protein